MRDTTKQKILDVSIRLLGDRGLDKTKVEDIVHEAGISRATFYNYFHGKEDIFFCLIETEIAKIQTNADRAIKDETDPYRKIRKYSLEVVLGAREMMRLLKVGEPGFETLPPAPRKLIETSTRRSLATIMEILDYGQKTGAFDVSNTELTAHVVLSALEIYINPSKLGGIENESIEDYVDELMAVLCHGFSKRPVALSGRAVKKKA